MIVASATNQGILDMLPKQQIMIYVDNKSAIAMAQNPVQHGRMKHLNTRFHALRDEEKNGKVKLVDCSSEEQEVDILTKALPTIKFKLQRMLRGVPIKNLKAEC